MMELVMLLLEAADPKDRESTYRSLERMGVDRDTADAMAAEFYATEKGVC